LLLQQYPSVLEADEDRKGHQCRILQLSMDDHRGYWLSLVRSDRRKLCTASFWGRQSGGAVVWFHSIDVSPKKPERPWDGPETAYREDNKRLALLTHSRDRTGCGLLVPYRTQTGSLTDRHGNCGRRGDHHALSLAGEEKDRKRDPLLNPLDGRHRISDMHLHVHFPARRTPRRILSRTLVGRLPSHRIHTRLRCQRGCRVVPRTSRTRMNLAPTRGQTTWRGKNIQVNPIFRLER